MYLNRECRHPELDALFIRKDVSTEVDGFARKVPALVTEFLDVLQGSLPGDSRNANCGECPFYDRCWPQGPFAVNRFYRMKWSDKLALERSGTMVEFTNVPKATRLTSIQRRQQEAAHVGDLVIESTLGSALDEWSGPLVYLDFETVAFAIPRFAGTTPWTKIPVQYSAHREEVGHRHMHFLAEGSDDPRPALAEALVSHCAGEGAVVTYHSSFEKGCIRGLVEAVPELSDALMHIHDRIVDLEPIIAHHVYHPDFRGSFSLKVVLPTLCPGVAYDGLPIADGSTAQLELARLLYGEAPVPPPEGKALRAALLIIQRASLPSAAARGVDTPGRRQIACRQVERI